MPGHMEARKNAKIGGDYRKVTDIVERINALQGQIEKAEEIQKDFARVAGWSDHRYFHAHDFGPWAADRLKEIAEKNLDEWVKANQVTTRSRRSTRPSTTSSCWDRSFDFTLGAEATCHPPAERAGFEVSATVKTAWHPERLTG